MPAIKVTVTVEVDGQVVDGFPYVRRLVVDQIQTFNPYSKVVDAGTFASLPVEKMATLQALVVRPDRQVTVRLDGQSDAGLVLNAEGILLILDADADASATTNATISNVSGATATVRGLGGGATT